MSKISNNNITLVSKYHHSVCSRTAACLLTCLLSACGFQSYQAKPISQEKKQSEYLSRTPESDGFKQFLISQNYSVATFPINQWGVHELTLSALFFHPDLNLSRAEWRVAMAEQSTASQRPELGASGSAGNYSKVDGDASPWTFEIGIDIPIETAGKREARIGRAVKLSEAARLEIGQTAWRVRSRLIKSWLDFQHASLQNEPLTKELAIRESIVEMLEKRLAAGVASSVEVSNARLALQKTQQNLTQNTGRTAELRAKLAGDAGLPLATFKQINITKVELLAISLKQNEYLINNEQLQQTALLNRLDIRATLARYAASEANLRMEIAKQYPNVNLNPSYTFDQNDHLWSLGLSSLLTLVYKNRGLIEEARALREVEAAKFERLQTDVINQLSQKRAAYITTKMAFEQASSYVQSLQARTQKSQRQFDAGLIDRLELANIQLENITAKQNVISAAYEMSLAITDIEDTIQRPVDDTLNMAAMIEGQSAK